MAFVQSTVALRSTFLRTGPVQARKCSIVNTPSMGLSDSLSSLGKGALVVSAVTIGAVIALPSESQAAFLKFPGKRPTDIGLRSERYLSSCPATPNCVSSMENVYDKHFVPAWTYNAVPNGPRKTMIEAIAEVTKVIEDTPRTTIVQSRATSSEVGQGHYIYAEYASKLFGFVDDVEFFFQPDNETVEYRSASRLGKSDLDANRKRIRDMRVTLQNTDKRWASVGF